MPDTLETYRLALSACSTLLKSIRAKALSGRLYEKAHGLGLDESTVGMVEPTGRCDDSLEPVTFLLASILQMVEPTGIEPVTSCVQGRRSPS